MQDLIEPQSGYLTEGYRYLGRGPSGRGWSRSPQLYYRCAKCGSMMNAAESDYWTCACGAMSLDIDAGRFGSWYGDKNILVYERLPHE